MLKFTCSFALQNKLLRYNTFSIKNFNQHLGSALRCMCSKTEDDRKEVTHNNTIKFREIYRFNGIRFGYYLHKLKWFQTIATIAAIPTSALLYLSGVIDDELAIAIVGSGALLTLNLYVSALLFHQTIGFMYISEDGTTLKVSYLDFWGNRVDEEHPVDDVMMFSDTPSLPTDRFFKNVMFFSKSKVKLRLILKPAKITDTDTFIKVFGPTK